MSDYLGASSWKATSFDVSRPCLHDDGGGGGRYWIKGANGMRVRYARAVLPRLRLSRDILDLKVDETRTYISFGSFGASQMNSVSS